jgi:hypothetical protein
VSGYRIHFHAKGDAEAMGLPEDAFLALTEALTDVLRDPWAATRLEDASVDPAFRWTPFGLGLGIVHVRIDDQARTVTVHGITWIG